MHHRVVEPLHSRATVTAYPTTASHRVTAPPSPCTTPTCRRTAVPPCQCPLCRCPPVSGTNTPSAIVSTDTSVPVHLAIAPTLGRTVSPAQSPQTVALLSCHPATALLGQPCHCITVPVHTAQPCRHTNVPALYRAGAPSCPRTTAVPPHPRASARPVPIQHAPPGHSTIRLRQPIAVGANTSRVHEQRHSGTLHPGCSTLGFPPAPRRRGQHSPCSRRHSSCPRAEPLRHTPPRVFHPWSAPGSSSTGTALLMSRSRTILVRPVRHQSSPLAIDRVVTQRPGRPAQSRAGPRP